MQLTITKKELECHVDLITHLDKLFGNNSGLEKGIEELRGKGTTKVTGGEVTFEENGNLIIHIQEDFFCDVLEIYKDILDDAFGIGLILKSMFKKYKKGFKQLEEKYHIAE